MLLAALQAHLPSYSRGGRQSELGMAAEVRVHANEVECKRSNSAQMVSSGTLVRHMQNALDKRAKVKELASVAKADGITVYVGDSVTDLGALLEADIGIVMGGNSTLARVAAAAGITIQPLITAPRTEAPPPGTLFQTGSWWEVAAFAAPAKRPPPGASAPAQANSTRNEVPTSTSGLESRGAARAQGEAQPASGVAQAGAHPQVPTVLTVAGSDSGGGAGIQADLKTFQARGVFGTSAIAALTAQNTRGVAGVHVPPADFLTAQMDAVLEDMDVHAVKTGMLPTVQAVHAVADAVQRHKVTALVVDPVLVASSGHSLADSDVAHVIVDRLLPLATVVTPNLAEAAALLGDSSPIQSLRGMEAAARRLHQLGARCLLVKGGHLASRGDAHEAVDVLFDGSTMQHLSAPRVDSRNTHGTGCTLAAAIAAELAKGLPAAEAVRAAKEYLSAALRSSADLQIGKGAHGPLNHGYATNRWGGGPSKRIDLRVYGVTDAASNAKLGRSNADAVSAAARGGMTIVQLREKLANGGNFLEEARAVIAAARPHGVPVIINDRVDVAMAAGADGVHVGQDDLPVALVRQLMGPHTILGVSCKTVEQARRAEADGADYLGVGAVFATPTKDSRVIGYEGLQAVCQATALPVVAIGGLNAQNAADAIHAGAQGIAVVRDIFANSDAASATQQLRAVVDQAIAKLS
ncbi:hypothetical protein WJX73_005744 [Symbiochloris irregularis]|uniref:thiamine phosphate synthase n=1 Tax=Symbiochloris irregularis TaxID=706552 RepID=A0AAW1PAD1_9CHLO